MNLKDYNIGGDHPQSCLFVGDSGTGKTIAACYWPGPLYIASCDGRMGAPAEWHRGRKDIEFDLFSDHESLMDKLKEFESSCPYKTLIVDPITNISSFLMRYSFAKRGEVVWNEETGRAKTTSKGKKKGVVDQTTYEDIGVEHRGIEDIIFSMKIISKTQGVNIILTGHLLTTTYMKVGGAESHMRRDIVTAGRKIVPFIPTQFDEYYHFYTENDRWLVKTYNDGIVSARSSFTRMPKVIDWTERDLYSLMKEYYFRTQTD